MHIDNLVVVSLGGAKNPSLSLCKEEAEKLARPTEKEKATGH